MLLKAFSTGLYQMWIKTSSTQYVDLSQVYRLKLMKNNDGKYSVDAHFLLLCQVTQREVSLSLKYFDNADEGLEWMKKLVKDSNTLFWDGDGENNSN